MYLKSEILTLTNTDISGFSLRDKVHLTSSIKACKDLINELDQNVK